eukprot:TRINITY_DN10147_c0_g1_i1.p1 TRINITY_DN10147_c0_g1~~TRINITY_DN10147_c0_g1_i1.p1  ORF type:complete len:309 (+),score=123.72 TRINITY_DN10147_c0_g1_i1:77-928(+)
MPAPVAGGGGGAGPPAPTAPAAPAGTKPKPVEVVVEEPPTITMEEALSGDSLVTWDCPVAPQDPRRTRKLRQKQGLSAQPGQTASVQAQDVIRRFIPPREWTDADGVQWVQEASTASASRLDCVLLQEKLDQQLFEAGARPTGVCPLRQGLYRQCFDEVLRQVTADGVERGILLLKVRQERERTIEAYKQILESRAGYAFRTALKGDKDTYRMTTRIAELKRKKQSLIDDEERLKQEELRVRAEGEEQAKEDEKRRKDELGMLLKEAQLKKAQLEAITALPKK